MCRCLAFMFIAFLVVHPTNAEDSLPPSIELILEKAAARDAANGTQTYLETATILAIDAYPAYTMAILDHVAMLAPDQNENLVAAIETVFPDIDLAATPDPPTVLTTKSEPVDPAGFISLSGWSGSVELGGTINSGNTSQQSGTLGFGLLNVRANWIHKLDGSFAFTRTNGTTSNRELEVSYQLDRRFNDRLYGFGQFEYEDKQFSGFGTRLTETVGIGYRLFDRQTWFVDLEIGPTARQSKEIATGRTENEFGGRIKSNLEWDISSTFKLINKSSLIHSNQRTTLENTIAVQTKITQALSGKVSFNVTHDTSVPVGTKKTNSQTKFTLLYGF